MRALRHLRPSRLLMRLRRLLRNDQLVLGILAVLIGAATAYAIILFREAIVFLQSIIFTATDGELVSIAAVLPWWWLLLATTLGGLAVGLFLRFLMPGQRPQGVSHVIEASALAAGRMTLKDGLAAAIVSALSIGAGASVGREGPAVHIGGSLAGWLGNKLHLGRNLSRSLLGCGVASAVAASFNAPIAGVLFAHEVVVGHYALSAFAPVVIASVTGTIIARARFGESPAFLLPEFELQSAWEFPAFAGLGILSGFAAVLLIRAIFRIEDQWNKMPVDFWLRPVFGGFAVGAIAIAFPAVMGVGHDTTTMALTGALGIWLMAALAVAKLVATAASLGSGFGGGIFSPSLTIGALMGGAYGGVATSIFPELSSGPAAYSLVGMGAMAAAVLGAPISTVLIIFEMTADYAMTIAVMIAVVIASVLTTQLHGASFFHTQLRRRGLDLRSGREAQLLRSLRVREVMKGAVTVTSDCRLGPVREKLQAVPYGEIFVLDEQGRLHGSITLSDLSEAAFDHGLDDLVNAEDVARPHPPVLAQGDTLEQALRLMTQSQEEHIAVVDTHQTQRLVGCVHETDVLLAYNRALIRVRAEERGDGQPAPPLF